MAETFSGTLTPNVVTTVTLSGVAETVTVRADGTDSIWFTTDGTNPTANARHLPRAAQGETTADVTGEDDPTVVKLISTGATAYRVTANSTVTPDAPPELPASPDAQDIADALVALGLVTQAEA